MVGDIMEIKAKSKFDFETSKALAHVSVYKKNNPKKTITARFIVCFMLLLAIICEYIAFDIDNSFLLLILVVVFVTLFDVFGYFFLPKIQYKSLLKMQDTENEYIFYDKFIKEFTKSTDYTAEANIEYSLFVKVYETSKYFFLFQTKNQVFVIDKSTIMGGTAEEIKNKLMPVVKNNYIVCKY